MTATLLIAFLIGLFIGASGGFLVAALCNMATRTDAHIEREMSQFPLESRRDREAW